jgi:hypothetical protein
MSRRYFFGVAVGAAAAIVGTSAVQKYTAPPWSFRHLHRRLVEGDIITFGGVFQPNGKPQRFIITSAVESELGYTIGLKPESKKKGAEENA